MHLKRSEKFDDVCIVKWDNCIFDAYDFRKLTGYKFVQENEVLNCTSNIVRGMGMQLKNPQGKLVRAVEGEIYDVIVDARVNSSTYGKWEAFELNDRNKEWLWIPPGYMHGYMTLKNSTLVQYKCTSYYCKNDEIGFKWNDPNIGIEWPFDEKDILISQRDSEYPLFCNLFK